MIIAYENVPECVSQMLLEQHIENPRVLLVPFYALPANKILCNLGLNNFELPLELKTLLNVQIHLYVTAEVMATLLPKMPADTVFHVPERTAASGQRSAAEHDTSGGMIPVVEEAEHASIALLGDSTIDNIVWTKSYTLSVAGMLRKIFRDDAVVINLAADGFTTTNMITGAVPNISWKERSEEDPFGIKKGAKFKPLLELASRNATCAVLSIGGNDIRVELGNLAAGIKRIQQTFVSNYTQIAGIIMGTLNNNRLILMFQYCPSINNDQIYKVYSSVNGLPLPASSPLDKLKLIMKSMYDPILSLARKYHLPIIDLPRTFNPNLDYLYESQIEPSKHGSRIISSMIAHVVKTHDFTGPSILYYDDHLMSLPPDHRKADAVPLATVDSITSHIKTDQNTVTSVWQP